MYSYRLKIKTVVAFYISLLTFWSLQICFNSTVWFSAQVTVAEEGLIVFSFGNTTFRCWISITFINWMKLHDRFVSDVSISITSQVVYYLILLQLSMRASRQWKLLSIKHCGYFLLANWNWISYLADAFKSFVFIHGMWCVRWALFLCMFHLYALTLSSCVFF